MKLCICLSMFSLFDETLRMKQFTTHSHDTRVVEHMKEQTTLGYNSRVAPLLSVTINSACVQVFACSIGMEDMVLEDR